MDEIHLAGPGVCGITSALEMTCNRFAKRNSVRRDTSGMTPILTDDSRRESCPEVAVYWGLKGGRNGSSGRAFRIDSIACVSMRSERFAKRNRALKEANSESGRCAGCCTGDSEEGCRARCRRVVPIDSSDPIRRLRRSAPVRSDS